MWLNFNCCSFTRGVCFGRRFDSTIETFITAISNHSQRQIKFTPENSRSAEEKVSQNLRSDYFGACQKSNPRSKSKAQNDLQPLAAAKPEKNKSKQSWQL